jgi:hypothetical protein
MLHALTGISYSTKFNQFSIAPKINRSNFQSFYITVSAWGTISQQILPEGMEFRISISYGELLLKSIQLGSFEASRPSVIQSCKLQNSEGEVNVKAQLNTKDTKLEIILLKPITLTLNQTLQVFLFLA